MFLTEKWDGKIKTRKISDVRKQHESIKKMDKASTRITLDGIMITSSIEAHEGRYVGNIYIRSLPVNWYWWENSDDF